MTTTSTNATITTATAAAGHYRNTNCMTLGKTSDMTAGQVWEHIQRGHSEVGTSNAQGLLANTGSQLCPVSVCQLCCATAMSGTHAEPALIVSASTRWPWRSAGHACLGKTVERQSLWAAYTREQQTPTRSVTGLITTALTTRN